MTAPYFADLFRNYAYPFANVVSVYDLVCHRNCVIRIADNAFSFGVKHKLLAAEDILTGSLALGAEISGGADKSPLYVVSL